MTLPQASDTALLLAIAARGTNVALLLLKRGANYNHVDSVLHAYSVLFCYCAGRATAARSYSVDDIPLRPVIQDGDTALTAAALMNLPEVVSELLGNRDIDLNHRNKARLRKFIVCVVGGLKAHFGLGAGR